MVDGVHGATVTQGVWDQLAELRQRMPPDYAIQIAGAQEQSSKGQRLIDQIEQDRRQGLPAWDAIVESAVRRFRLIVLAAAAAVLAMIPLTRSVFWGPMAAAIMGGLIVATALTLLALPAMYAAWFRMRRPTLANSGAAAG